MTKQDIFYKLQLNDILKVWVTSSKETVIRYYRVVAVQNTPTKVKLIRSTDKSGLLLKADSLLFNFTKWYPKMKILEGKEKEAVKTLYF